ncbi:hypothetical protein M885DRAFT_504201 [Pelagophyceae sp. CCMP2097]|nr:hypothetical protein M885DRAFT_504201 [Pelagophyceae sp. CCMP2097]
MSAYANVIVGGLSLKKNKKGKKKRAAEESFIALEGAPSSNDADASAEPQDEASDLTDAQLRFQKRQKKDLAERVSKSLEKSHREKIDELNAHLGSLTEHNDCPRISAMGNG